MKILSIEPTPSPNTMKVLLDQELPAGKSNNYKKENVDQAPEIIQDIMNIEGIKGVYHVADFLAIERNAKFDWKVILPQVRECFGEQQTDGSNQESRLDDSFGEVKVFVQMIGGIPMQIKVTDGSEEERFGLPEQFIQASIEAQKGTGNVIQERSWKEMGVRYGDLKDIGKEVSEELVASYNGERLNRLVSIAKEGSSNPTKQKRSIFKVTEEMLEDKDWTKRYAALEQMNPTIDDIHVLKKALADEKASIRRLATVYLGMIEDEKVLPLLYTALKDKSVTVRRTAGDCLSDIGNPDSIEPMCKALKDPNKLVRWRAAMFLYEVGDESAVSALKQAQDDTEFEVSMQIKLAIERIEGGEQAKGSVWKQMTESRK
ncbi:conserved virulence factor C family protein [Bacillus timonensis]|nr:conserved virulence factor C family protein [Bacillus timonensis]